MTTSDDSAPAAPHAGDRLRQKKERVILLWEAKMREEVPAARAQSHPILVNTLPAILDQLAEALTPDHPRQTATQGSTAASEHGGERVRLTHFRLEDLIGEYRLLRQVLFDVLDEKDHPLSSHERATLHTSVDEALSQACTGYALVESTWREQLFAMVAHDLRSPLGAASTSATLILLNPAAEAVPRLAALVVENIRRADRMVQDLLDAIRMQAGARLEIELVECDLVAIVRGTLENLAIEHGDRFVLLAPASMRGYLAPDHLRRAVENLASNAVKYGSPAGRVTVTMSEQHGRAIVSVHNVGAYIPAEQQETLFRAFQRSTAGEESGHRGWGLGLAQVRAVAEAHGGSIALSSLPESGTVFVIDIPLDARPYQEKPTIL